MALTGLLGVTLAVAASRAEAVVYRVDVGLGGERVIGAGSEKVQPSDAQIAYVLTRFIENIRSLSSDPIVVRSNWHDAYAHLTDRGAEQLNRHVLAANAFANIGTRTVSVEVIAVFRLSTRTFAIRWVEATYENGLQIAAEGFSGVIEIVFEPPRTTDALPPDRWRPSRTPAQAHGRTGAQGSGVGYPPGPGTKQNTRHPSSSSIAHRIGSPVGLP